MPRLRHIVPIAITVALLALPAAAAEPETRFELTSMGSSIYFSGYEERYAAGQSLARSPARLVSLNLEGRGRAPWLRPFWPEPRQVLPSWLYRLDLAQTVYAMQDEFLPVSTHVRQEWRAELSALREALWNEIGLSIGPGLLLRWEQALHSGAPPTPNYAFSSGRWLFGPQLVGNFRWFFDDEQRQAPDFGRWRLIGSAALAPYVWSRIDPGLPELPWLVGSRLEIGVEHQWARIRTSLTLRHWGLRGTGYEESFIGPALHVSWQPYAEDGNYR